MPLLRSLVSPPRSMRSPRSGSPPWRTSIRDTFDLMPTATEADWSTIAEKLSNLPGAVDGYIETLRQGVADGVVPARRQVIETATGVRRHADPLGFFFDFTGAAALEGGGALPDSLK